MTAVTHAPRPLLKSSAISTTISDLTAAWRERVWSMHQRSSPTRTVWTFDVSTESSYASEFDLRRFALQRIAGLRASGDYAESQVTKERLESLLTHLVEDGGPTPQVAATPDNSVEVQWLCNGTLLAALIEHDGEVCLMAEDSKSNAVFDYEFTSNEPISDDAIGEAKQLLRSMALHVKQRPFDWHISR